MTTTRARAPRGSWTRPWALAAAACLALAAASLLIPASPGYDPWMWLHWGREVAGGQLETAEGPAFKPLPVAITAVLTVAGDAAPELWLVLARAGALAAVGLAAVVAAELARGAGAGGRWPLLAGAAAAVGVLLTERFVLHAAVGDTEPALLALVLGALLAARGDRHGLALALGIGAALLRSETWPFLAAYGLWRWRVAPAQRPALAAAAVLVPVTWLGPEWLSSGELLRSTDRALAPNPGAPALAERPAAETLLRAAGLLFPPTALAALAARRAAAVPALAGLAWLGLVAAMSEVGFSGEERYALPGAAAIAVSGGAAVGVLAARGRPWLVIVLALLLTETVVGIDRTARLGPVLADRAELAGDLPAAIAAAGGREAVLRCGTPAVGRLRGPLLAWHLEVAKARIRADDRPGGVTFRSRLSPSSPVTPPATPGARAVEVGRWRVERNPNRFGRC